MNVLFIGTTDILGGAAKVSWIIKEALEKRGDAVSMFVADKRSDDDRVHVIPRQSWRKYVGIALATDTMPNTDWILETKAYQEADIVHCHNLHGRFFNLKTMQKMSQEKHVVWTLHDEWAITPHCAYTLEGEAVKHGLFVCPSKHTQPRILWDNTKALAGRKISIYKNSKMTVVSPSLWLQLRVAKTPLGNQALKHIPNGIDTRAFVRTDKAEARKRLGLPADKKIALFLAVDAKRNTWKGWRYTREVIDAYQHDTSVCFVSVGNFIEHEDTNQIIHRGHVADPAELALYYSAADTLLFTSIAENFPLVILEAMSVGVPIVAFDVGGVAEVLEHKKHGYVAAYKNVSQLLEGLRWSLSLSEEQQRLLAQSSGEVIRSKYDVKHMVQNYLQLYQSLL